MNHLRPAVTMCVHGKYVFLVGAIRSAGGPQAAIHRASPAACGSLPQGESKGAGNALSALLPSLVQLEDTPVAVRIGRLLRDRADDRAGLSGSRRLSFSDAPTTAAWMDRMLHRSS